MRIAPKHRREGIALIIVMIVIVTLSVLAAGFAYSMKVETKLARNATYQSDMDLMARSGVELARYVLGQQLAIPQEGSYAALNQKWAGGYGGTNELLAWINMDHNEIGNGSFGLKIVDAERKFNLSLIREGNSIVLENALTAIGVDSSQLSTIIDSFFDWVDPDEVARFNGAESEFYLGFNPSAPYFSKNGPPDDITELLLIRGMTEEVFWGARRVGFGGGRGRGRGPTPVDASLAGAGVGLFDLFTTVGGAGMAVNINTAPPEVLQLVPGMDPSLAHGVLSLRAGSDGVDGTEDDTPLMNPGELINLPGMDPAIINSIRPFVATQSFIFEVSVEARVGQYRRHYTALLHRRNRQDVQILYGSWK